MCGIIGYVGKRIAERVLIDALKKLEYRGYDSSGISVFNDGTLSTFRKVGKLINLESDLAERALTSRIGIGHTRWATHGKPTELNAHPHSSTKNKITVVHNGIIENYLEIKQQLEKECNFQSETDTEVIAHLLEKCYAVEGDLLKAVACTVKTLKGSYALAVLCQDKSNEIVVAKNSSPLILGLGKGEMFVASDITAILSYTNKSMVLEDGDIGVITKNTVQVYDKELKKVTREIREIKWDAVLAEKDGYKHFMLKEIYEQPQVIEDTLRGRVNLEENDVAFDYVNLNEEDIKNIDRVVILACGTSYHAGLIAKFLMEDLVGIPCEVDIASEFRYRKHLNVLNAETLVIAISQSGETADTIASFEAAKKANVKNLVISNVIDSTLARKSDNVVYTRCGPEIGVASTKAFTAQLCVLYLVAIFLGKKRKSIDNDLVALVLKELLKLSQKMSQALKNTKAIMEDWAKKFHKKHSFLYLGRNINYPIALEGALKLKEISYIHAEGYPAGEMKHGPIALIDENMPVLTIATQSSVYDKIAANVEEARARGGRMLVIASEGNDKIRYQSEFVVYVPKTMEILTPMLNIIPLQFLSYYIAEIRGCDVDQPRNLAKSVTVE
ncbi:MAG: glutamine--fructose-6-phosphate transaminase (isomerizing) [Bacteroidetes bacterium]|nr:glutamine--fructose-6-phosphate transaminase (isomerizing) [Bacteroidota bacterium]